MALHHGLWPATPHFQTPNPKIDFASSPFYVNTLPLEWPPGPIPRRAGVSSFGIGGSNAHVILEEAPPEGALSVEPPGADPAASARAHLLLLSARSEPALERITAYLQSYLERHRDCDLANVGIYTPGGPIQIRIPQASHRPRRPHWPRSPFSGGNHTVL